VYEEMAACRHQPNTTTYNALISGGLSFQAFVPGQAPV
jgi:hypothetical protein